MTSGYDEPRSDPKPSADDSFSWPGDGGGRRPVIDTDDESTDPAELPDSDVSDELALQTEILAQQADEFICARCFLVEHKSRLASATDGNRICVDCA